MNIRMITTGAIGIAVVAFAVGGYLGGIFPGIGPGPGFSGSGPGENPQSREPERPSPSAAPEAELAGVVGDANRMLLIHIDGRSYSIGEAHGEKTVLRSVSLDEIADLAAGRPGNPDGVRARISRAQSSRTVAEIALRDVLMKAGLKAEEIEWEDGPPP